MSSSANSAMTSSTGDMRNQRITNFFGPIRGDKEKRPAEDLADTSAKRHKTTTPVDLSDTTSEDEDVVGKNPGVCSAKIVRIVKTATRVKIPLPGDPTLLARSPKNTESTIHTILRSTYLVVAEYAASLLNAPFDEFIQRHGVDKLADSFVSTVVNSSIPVLKALAQGTTPSEEDMESAVPVRTSSAFNVCRIYLHCGRNGEPYFARGGYMGSGRAFTPKSKGGYSNLVGILRRVVAEHGSAHFRQGENRAEEGDKHSVHHYRMYDANDTATEHLYLLLAYRTPQETWNFLGHQACAGGEWSSTARSDLAALIGLEECCLILSTGFYRSCKKLMRIAGEKGLIVPKQNFKLRNRSPGLDFMGGGGGVKGPMNEERKAERRLHYGKKMGLAEGKEGSHSAYVERTYGKDVVTAWRSSAGVQTRNKGYKTYIKSWRANEPVAVNFPKDVALWRFCRNPCQETLKPFFSEHLRTGADLGLKVALRGNCQHQGANGFKNPEKGLMFFLLDFGEADADGLPTSENMTLRVYEVTDAEAIAAGTAAIKEAAKSPTKRRAVQRCAGEDLQFSLESARRWDLDPSVATKKRKDGRNEWTYAQRWESFVEWVRLICLMVAMDEEE